MEKQLERTGKQSKIGRRDFIGQSLALTAAATLGPLSSSATAATGIKAAWLSHHTYVAPDLAQTCDWYQEVFGMQLGYQDASRAHLWFGDEGGDTLMIVVQARPGEKAPRITRFGFTLEDWDRSAVERELKRSGLNPRADTDRGFWFNDPESNEIGVFARDYVTRPAGRPPEPQVWKALSANHIVVTSRDYRKLGDWYGDLLDLRETSDAGRDVYQWFGDSVWIPTAVREGAMPSFELHSLDHVAYTIANYNSADVEAELRSRKMIEPDDNVAGSIGINCVDINGFKTQICDIDLVSDAEKRRG